MSLSAPLGLLAAAFVAPLVVWYLLRARRPRVDVSSTWLWREDDGSVTAALPWQRFRGDVTFWLVLLAILVAAVALARPALPTRTVLGDHTILLMDSSASMLAVEDGPTRLELARREAERLVEGVGPGQLVSVVEAGPRARVLLSASADANAVRRALGQVDLSEAAADLGDAFTLAAALQRPGQDTVVHLLTDGELPAEHAASAPDGLRVTSVGSATDNLAVTRLQAVTTTTGRASAFVEVRNFGQTPADALVDLRVDGVTVDTEQVSLPARGSQTVLSDVAVVPAQQADHAVLTATLVTEDGDALALDDTAAVVVTGATALRVLVAGPGNVFIESALAAAGAEVRTAPTVPDELAGIDLLVVDGVDGPARPPVPTLYVAPTSTAAGIEQLQEVERPVVTFQAPEAALLADVDLSSIAIAAARPAEAPGFEALVAGPDGVLVAAGRVDGRRVLHVGFDLRDSNLPLDVAWPVLVGNVLTELAGADARAPAVVGAEVDLQPPPGATAVELSPPGGQARQLDRTRAVARLDRVGIWDVAWVGDEQALAAADPPLPLAVQPLPAESDLARPAPTASSDAGGTTVTTTDGVRLIGSGLLTAALLALLVEWAWAHGVGPGRFRRGRRARRRTGRATAGSRSRRQAGV